MNVRNPIFLTFCTRDHMLSICSSKKILLINNIIHIIWFCCSKQILLRNKLIEFFLSVTACKELYILYCVLCILYIVCVGVNMFSIGSSKEILLIHIFSIMFACVHVGSLCLSLIFSYFLQIQAKPGAARQTPSSLIISLAQSVFFPTWQLM